MTLFINACARKNSRTRRLAKALLAKRGKPFEEVCLYGIDFPLTDGEYLEKRDLLIGKGRFDDPLFALARQFAAADDIIIAATYWDLSFPAVLKQYFEHINVLGVTFYYNDEGVPKGLCRAKRLTYVTTAGGNYVPDDYGFGYVRELCRAFYGISEVKLIKAAGLDIAGADAEDILKKTENEMI